MKKSEILSYKFQFFIMDVTVPEHYEASQCYVSLVSDQFEEIYSRKSKVRNQLAQIQTTLRPKMVLCLNRRSSQYIPPFVKLQVYVASNERCNSNSVIGSLTFDLLEQLVNPNLKEIRQQLVGTDVRIRLSIISYPYQQQRQYKNISTKSILRQIENIEQSTQQNKFPDFFKQKTLRQKAQCLLFQKQPQDLNFSQIMPGDVSSKVNESTSFEYNKYQNLYLQVVRLNQQILKFREQTHNLLAQNEQLKQMNAQLDQINTRLSNDLGNADQKLIKLEKLLNIYEQKGNNFNNLKLELQSQSEIQKKNSKQLELRNAQMISYINELHVNQLKLNHTIAQHQCHIQQLQKRIHQNKSNPSGDIQSSICIFNEALTNWRKSSSDTSYYQKQIISLVKSLKKKQKTIKQNIFTNCVVQQLQKLSIQLIQLKKEYLFKSQLSIINLINQKVQSILNDI